MLNSAKTAASATSNDASTTQTKEQTNEKIIARYALSASTHNTYRIRADTGSPEDKAKTAEIGLHIYSLSYAKNADNKTIKVEKLIHTVKHEPAKVKKIVGSNGCNIWRDFVIIDIVRANKDKLNQDNVAFVTGEIKFNGKTYQTHRTNIQWGKLEHKSWKLQRNDADKARKKLNEIVTGIDESKFKMNGANDAAALNLIKDTLARLGWLSAEGAKEQGFGKQTQTAVAKFQSEYKPQDLSRYYNMANDEKGTIGRDTLLGMDEALFYYRLFDSSLSKSEKLNNIAEGSDYTVYKKGDKESAQNNEIKLIQAALVERLNITAEDIKNQRKQMIDGDFDDFTEDAVKCFQKSYLLWNKDEKATLRVEVNGKIDRATLLAIDDVLVYGLNTNNQTLPRGEKTWAYKVGDGDLYNPDGKLIYKEGYAGAQKPCDINEKKVEIPCKNNSEYEDRKNLGPIPRGLWWIGSHYTDTNSEGKMHEYKIRLCPLIGTNTFGRTQFRIHGDSNPSGEASEGCIIFPKDIRIKIASSTVRLLKVI
ncbi:MAG: DUF2778 domain-containing protein [Helicobacteraceae bacterium]|nr:DUF2778 domain-containing protein [Helicobacteraceae bacterium]